MKFTLVLLLAYLSNMAFANTVTDNTITGNIINKNFYPELQGWKVVGIKKSPTIGKLSNFDDIATDLLNSFVYFSDRYIVVKNLLSSSNHVIPSCFKQVKNSIHTSTFSNIKSIKKSFIINQHDDFIIMPYENRFVLKLVKQPLASDFHSNKQVFDAEYNSQLDRIAVNSSPCYLSKIDLPGLKNTDLVISSKEHGTSVTLKNHNLDRRTYIEYQYVSNSEEYYADDDNIEKVGNCLIKKYQYQLAKDRESKNIFYLIEKIKGTNIRTLRNCSKISSIKKFNTSPMLDLYSKNDSDLSFLLPITSLRFENIEEDEDAVITSHFNNSTNSEIQFLLSNIQSNHITIELLDSKN